MCQHLLKFRNSIRIFFSKEQKRGIPYSCIDRVIQLNLQDQGGMEFQPVSYPSSKVLYLEAIKEHVPVFDGKFRISQDVTVIPSKELVSALASGEKTIVIAGELKYQACDKTVCFSPSSVPVKWQFQILALDMKRSPEGIRHK